QAGIKLVRDVHHKRWPYIMIEARIKNLERAMGAAKIFVTCLLGCNWFQLYLAQPGQKTRFVSKSRAGVVIGMAALPVGKNDNSWALFAYHPCDLHPVLPGIFHAAIGNIESLPEAGLQNPRSFIGFAGSILDRAAGAHFPLRQVEDSGAVSLLRHLEQSAAAGLLNVVAVGGNSKNVQRG